MMRYLLIAILAASAFSADALAWYSPRTGTFMQRDPAGYIDEMNLYRYVASNPMRYVDPMGLHRELPDREWGPWRGPVELDPDFIGPPQPPIPSRGNCYRFACNDPINNPREPHNINPGGILPTSCDSIKRDALKDGLSEPDKCSGDCPAGTTKVGYGISKQSLDQLLPGRGFPSGIHDHHWWRRTRDGWKDKPGYAPASDTGGEPGVPGTDTGIYKFCGYLCSPDGIDLHR